ncbi:hypothetical protein [Altericista sp. CCNU0014]|uniref:hypothetical protein n=1 Tax=Altericista sp. CCNU0014 TaxID=3082949 RepID=UPI003850C9CB
MTYPEPERYIPVQLRLLASHPALLEGLDNWLNLGLISDREVQVLCQRYLTCVLSERKTAPSTPASRPAIADAATTPAAIAERQVAIAAPQASAPPPIPKSQGWVSQFLQSLINEVSVIWLLCLGVFLVVASSAVLAANQWNNLSPAGQYGILLTYTLAFAGSSVWTATKPQLQITARMLQVASLLLIPVNFWMMDGFRLLHDPGGIAVAAIAAVVLSAAVLLLMPRRLHPRWIAANVLGLSWLHWGWGWEAVPVVATYIGCVGTAAVLLGQQRAEPTEDSQTAGWSRISAANIALPFAVLLLLFRAFAIAKVPLAQLGLAFGLCGWLLCRQTRFQPSQRIWASIGLGLLAIGWLVCVGAAVPWQALLVCGLGLWLLGDRLLLHRNPGDLIGIFVVGLLGLHSLVGLNPLVLREAFVAVCTKWVGPQGLPAALWGVGLFPYLWGFLRLAAALRRARQPHLVRVAYGLSWVLGVCLVGLSALNPTLRSLSLWLALLTLGATVRRQPVREVLVYVNHLLGVAAVFSTLDNIAPQLAMYQWGTAAVAGAILEWIALLALARQPLWQRSAWFVGLGLAGLGYVLAIVSVEPAPGLWGSAALAIPTALTALTFFPQFGWPRQAIGLGAISTIAVQLLTFETLVPRLVGLALGIVLTAIHTARMPNPLFAALSVGFGLTFGYAVGWEVLPHTFQNWMLLSVGLLWSAIALRHGLSYGRWSFSLPFQLALDGWAIALTVWISFPLAALSLWVTPGSSLWIAPQLWAYPLSGGLMTAASIYRYAQAPAQGWWVGIAWTAEVLLLSVLKYYLQLPFYSVAIATLALGLLSVLLGEFWVRRAGQSYRWSWNLIPLGYGVVGWLLGHTAWTAETGFYTLALAAIGLGVGRRQPPLLPVTILGVLGVSLGAFELVLYPLLQARGGQPGDGLVVLSAVALGLALVYRVSHRWGERLLNLPPGGLAILAHVHWGVGTFLATIALPELSGMGERLWGAELLLLGGYALWQGRQQPIWIYAGLVQVLMALGQTLYDCLPSAQVLPWAGAIASAVALGIYSLPWQRWGWAQPPFTRVAIALPAAVALTSAFQINTSSLLSIGGFYGWIAFATQIARLSYLGLPAANWAALKLLGELHLTSPVWTVGLVGLSLLFVAQIDPAFQATSRRDVRHLLRCFAVGLVSVTALYESDVYFWSGVLTIGFSLGLVLLGLVLRVRAFLYVGTLTFVFKVLRLIWLFVARESQTLWILAFIPGLLIIWIAMTFEARRSQVTALLQYWVTALEEWQ